MDVFIIEDIIQCQKKINTTMEQELRKLARKRVRRVKRFYYHLSAFVIVGLFFFFMNVTTDPFDVWFFYPMMPWAVGLSFHYLAVFGIPGTDILTKRWEEREFEKQMDRLESQYEDSYYTSGSKRRKYLSYTELTADQEDLLEGLNHGNSNKGFV